MLEHKVFYDSLMSVKCLKCFRSSQSCYCQSITAIETGVKFIFLMHPQEAYKQKTGTGRLASLSLVNSEIIIDTSFDKNLRIKELLSDTAYYPMVLYPGKEVHYAESFNFESSTENKKLLVFLIDATWIFARKMMFRSPNLQKLPKLSFSNEYRSEFIIKKQPEEYCLSTIESSYYLIKELQKSEVCDPKINVDGLMTVFKKMVHYQLSCKEKRLELKQTTV